ncbi:5-formyltetrahydrofolate cyclo-ligase [Flavicella sp.]|uniref:5-formyltetrahydrofolate cyclo-ligase n=1 Tax=Flavicella sp. TaxID=2957742 RepID=UPI003017DF8E
MLKTEARRKFKSKRIALSNDKIEEQSIAIANQLLKLKPESFWKNNLYFHLFLSIQEQREINTEHILNILFAKDKEIVVSKSDFEKGEMINYLLTENTRIKKNQYNIPEPIDGIEVPHNKIDVVFIPLLAYDTSGNRVGYGKGFYDRFLEKTDCIKIGLSLFEPIENISDTVSTDIALNYCITPKNIYSF